jgi:hypothetical protein
MQNVLVLAGVTYEGTQVTPWQLFLSMTAAHVSAPVSSTGMFNPGAEGALNKVPRHIGPPDDRRPRKRMTTTGGRHR